MFTSYLDGFTAPARPNTGNTGKQIVLKANYFKVTIPNGDLHHYDVDIKPDKCPRRVNREIIETMVENFRNAIFLVSFQNLNSIFLDKFVNFPQKVLKITKNVLGSSPCI